MPKGKAKAKVERPAPPAPHNPIVEPPGGADNPDRGLDRVAVLEPTANVPYRVLPPQDDKAISKAQKDAQTKAGKDQQASAKARDEAAKKAAKDKESRAVQVRAIAKGFYPHDGRIRNVGDEFTYHLHRDPKTGKLEDTLPTWMAHVDGELETRQAGELSAVEAQPEPTVIEVTGQDVHVKKGSSSVI